MRRLLILLAKGLTHDREMEHMHNHYSARIRRLEKMVAHPEDVPTPVLREEIEFIKNREEQDKKFRKSLLNSMR